MPELLERPISTLPEFCQATCELGMTSARRRLWFRGVDNVDYPLVPRLYRSDSEAADLLALEQDMDGMAEGAAAMWGLYNIPRIAAQRGVFTVLGRDKRSLQGVFEEGDFPDTTLCRFRLPQAALTEMNEQLRILGFRESMIYPDLGGLATEIRVEQGLA